MYVNEVTFSGKHNYCRKLDAS